MKMKLKVKNKKIKQINILFILYLFIYIYFFFFFFFLSNNIGVKEENKALIVFVRNVIQKMMSDPHLEEVEDSSRVGHRPIPPKPTRHSRSQSISYLTKPFSFFSH